MKTTLRSLLLDTEGPGRVGNVALIDRSSVEAALTVATRAPSIHNTQPWCWDFNGHVLELRADRSRQLAIADPDGHSLMISCGAALALTEVGLRAAGWAVTTDRLPDSSDRDLLARFSHARHIDVTDVDRRRARNAFARNSDRRPFQPGLVPQETMESLRGAADGMGTHLHFPTRTDEQTHLAVAVSWADRIERNDAAYVAELASWVREVPENDDGIPLSAVPQVTPEHPRHADVPLRDFQVGLSGRDLIERDVAEHPLIAVLLSESDSPLDWLQAGESMMRLMLEAEDVGLASCPLSQAVDLVAFRSRLQTRMGWQGYPQMMLRLGYPTQSGDPVPSTPRRPLDSILHVTASRS
jgi:nitroreductase